MPIEVDSIAEQGIYILQVGMYYDWIESISEILNLLTQRCILPSGIVVPVRFAPSNFAPVKFARRRLV